MRMKIIERHKSNKLRKNNNQSTITIYTSCIMRLSVEEIALLWKPFHVYDMPFIPR